MEERGYSGSAFYQAPPRQKSVPTANNIQANIMAHSTSPPMPHAWWSTLVATPLAFAFTPRRR